jgi:hypothetical protein
MAREMIERIVIIRVVMTIPQLIATIVTPRITNALKSTIVIAIKSIVVVAEVEVTAENGPAKEGRNLRPRAKIKIMGAMTAGEIAVAVRRMTNIRASIIESRPYKAIQLMIHNTHTNICTG